MNLMIPTSLFRWTKKAQDYDFEKWVVSGEIVENDDGTLRVQQVRIRRNGGHWIPLTVFQNWHSANKNMVENDLRDYFKKMRDR